MFIDAQNELSDSQAVTASAISTNVIDIKRGADNVLADIGTGKEIYLVIQVDESATAAGAATVQFSVESDSTTDLATSATVHWQSAAIGKATLVAGYQVAAIRLPAGSYEEFLGLRYTVATGPLTAGKFSAFLTDQPQASRHYAKRYAV